MTIKNETAFTKECMEGAIRASNFDNSRYKTFKLAYNLFGLIFGMMMIRELVLKMTGNEQADTFMIVLFGLVAVVFYTLEWLEWIRAIRRNSIIYMERW